jgi:O-antigen ligase
MGSSVDGRTGHRAQSPYHPQVLVVVVVAAAALLMLGLLLAVRAPMAALALFAAVVPFGSSLPVPLPSPLDDLSSALGAVVIGALAVRHAVATHRPLPVAPTTGVWALLLAVAALTALWSRDPLATLAGAAVLAGLVALYAVVAATPVTRRELRIVETAIVMGGAAVGAYAGYLAATGRLAYAVDQRFVAAPGGSETGPVADPNVTAAALLLPFLLSVAMAFRHGPALLRAGAALAASLTFVAVFLTGSRGGLLALVLGLVALIVLAPHRTRAAALLVVPVLGAVVAVALAPASVTERVSSDSRSSGRSDIWRIGVLSCPQHCLQGSGWSTFPLVHEDRWLTDPAARGVQRRFEAHNIWLSTFVEGGVTALALLVAGLALTMRALLRLPRALRAPPLAALIAVLLANAFLSTLAFKYFWLVLLYAALVQNVTATDSPRMGQWTAREGSLA